MMFISFNEYSAVLDQAFHPFSSGHPTTETYQTSLKTREQDVIVDHYHVNTLHINIGCYSEGPVYGSPVCGEPGMLQTFGWPQCVCP